MHIDINHLHKVYRGGVHALTDITLVVPTGTYGLLGPNGAGKTTLMRILAGILYPTSGTIHVGDYDVTTEQGRAAIKHILGYLPQILGIYPDLTVREFLDYMAILKGMNEHRVRQLRIEEVLELASLSDVASCKLRTFSGGMKRRIGIAQALLNDPALLIVDEPTAGMDPEERIRLRKLLADLGSNRIVLLSTHIVDDIAQTCSHVAIMNRGRAIFQGSTLEMAHEASGRVWTITTAGPRPAGDIIVVSTINVGTTVHYRVVGELADASAATPVEPSLQDSYLWLMREGQPPKKSS
jgi:ABC-type multidrug transport system ATPase subunit